MVSLQDLPRISEIEFSDIVDTTELIGVKLLVLLRKGGFIDIWQSRKLPDRFGFHWETDRRGFLFVMTIFLIRNGNTFLLTRITFTMDRRIMLLNHHNLKKI